MNAKVKELAIASPATGGVSLRTNSDVVAARRSGRELGASIGLSATQQTAVATAIAELCKNALQYAGGGEIRFTIVESDNRVGLQIEVLDNGPGIANVKRALSGGYSTSGGLGIGLSGVRRIMDTFTLRSKAGEGTHVSALKWK